MKFAKIYDLQQKIYDLQQKTYDLHRLKLRIYLYLHIIYFQLFNCINNTVLNVEEKDQSFLTILICIYSSNF
jgi:hypothetical protein